MIFIRIRAISLAQFTIYNITRETESRFFNALLVHWKKTSIKNSITAGIIVTLVVNKPHKNHIQNHF